MIIFLIAAAADVLSIISSKWTLTKQKLNPNSFNSLLFIFLALFSGLALYDLGYLDSQTVFEPKYLFLLAVMVAVAWAWNKLHTLALKHEQLDNYELVITTTPFFTILFSSLFLPAERDPKLLIAGFLIALTLIFTHLKKLHLNFQKFDRFLILAVLLISVEAIIIKFLLTAWSPTALYFTRTALLALIFTLANPPKLSQITRPQWLGLTLSGLLGAIFKISQYIGYNQAGVILTTMVLAIAPLAVILLDKLLLKEKPHLKYILGVLIISAAILWALRA